MTKTPILRFLLFCVSLLITLGTLGQSQLKVTGGRIERIHKDGNASFIVPEYRGDLKWQFSIDGVEWFDIPGASSSTFDIPIPLSIFYRVGVKELNCDWIYSDFIKVIPVLPPVVATTSIHGLDADTLICRAVVTDTGGDVILTRGFCWNLIGDPDITSDFKYSNSSELQFVDTIFGFLPNTNYFLRSFATNWAGTSYGDVLEFKTPIYRPVLDQLTLTALTDSSAIAGATVVFDGGGTISEEGICWSVSENPDLTDTYTLVSLIANTFTCVIPDLDPVTTYYFRAFSMNEAGISFSANYSFTTPIRVPSLNTLPVTDLTNHSGKSGGKLLYNGGGEVLERGVCYSIDEMPDLNDQFIPVSGVEIEYIAEIKGLTRYTSYFVRAYATNSAGTGYGNQVELATKADKAVLTTSFVTNVTASSAQSGGEITDAGGASSMQKGVCWSTATSPEITDNKTIETIDSYTFPSVMTGLQPNVKYYIRAYSINPAGIAYGNQRSFTTLIGLPVVITKNTTSITAYGAVVSGEVTSASGGTISSRGFYWSLNPNPSSADNVALSGTGTGNFTAILTGLAPNTKYYVKSFANNQTGTTTGNEITFTTLIAPPTITTTAASSITDIGASSGGNVTNAGGGNVSARGICWSLFPAPDLTDNIINGGTGTGLFASVIAGLSPNTKYYVRAYATNEAGTTLGDEINFTTLIGLPVVITKSTTSITASGALLSGEVTTAAGGTISSRGFYWGVNPNPSSADNVALSGTGTGNFTASLTGLAPNTKYYIKSFANNQTGTTTGAEVSFTTLIALPTLTTTAASSITDTGATSGGNVTNAGGGTISARGICWSLFPAPDLTSNVVGGGAGSGVFTGAMTGLTPNTKYYVRSYATNEAGSSYGAEINFTTLIGLPVVTTAAPSGLSATSALLGGNAVYASGGNITSRGIYYSLTPAPGLTSTKVVMGSGLGAFSQTVTGLTPNTKYYVKAYVTNETATTLGNEVNFTTSIALPTVVTTNPVTSITTTSAQAAGNVTNDGNGTVSSRGICYSTTNNPTTSNSIVVSGLGTGAFTANLTGLQPNITYYIRAFAVNEAGTGYGSQVSFTTDVALPTVTTGAPAVNISSTGARLSGTVTDVGGGTVTTRGICWGTSTAPTLSNSFLVSGSGLGSYTADATGLNPFTTYYFRAYALNQKGITYGNEESFTTLVGLPSVTTFSPFTSITSTSAVGGGTVVNSGGGTVIVRGTCWSSTAVPTISDTHTSDGTGTGVFVSNLTGLAANTTYYCRAYATNQIGTSYGSQVTFKTDDNGAYRTVPVLTSSVRSDFKGWKGIFPDRSYAGSNGYSGITFDWDRNQLYIVANNARCYWVIHAPGYGTWSDSNPGAGFIKTVTLTGFVDAESINYLGNNWLMIGDELDRQVKFYKINDQTTEINNNSPDLILDPTKIFSSSDALNSNYMLEGIAYDFYNKKIYGLCQVGSNNHARLYMWDWSVSGKNIIPGTQVELSSTFEGFNSDFNMGNDLFYSPLLRRLFVIGAADKTIVEYDCYAPGTPEFGKKIGQMTVPLSNGSSGSDLGTAAEGICLSPNGRYIYICLENNGFGYAPVPHIRTAADNGLPSSLYPFQ